MPAELLAQGFTVAAGQGHGMMFRRHPAIQDADNGPARRRLLERRPAAVFFVPAGPLLTGVVEQALPDGLPLGLGAV